MSEWIDGWLPALGNYLTVEKTLLLVRAAVLLLGGMLVARLGGSVVHRLTSERFEPQQSMLFRRIASYGLMALFVVMALHQLGFNLSVLLGAAGIFSVALGFASQTSASNLVSGLFLIGEKPFGVGDVIQVGSTTGEVLSIDLMSVKLRTFDNLFVRIPNESLIKSEVRTLTKFPIRRCDLTIGIAYKEDVERVRRLLFDLADRNPLCLDEPKPVFIVQGFGDSSVNLQFSPWALRENFLELKNVLQREIKEAFDANGIEIPFPHRTFYTGAETAPFPVRIVGGQDEVGSDEAASA
ncbi:MAG: mechanosensitive ion channel family protein [Thermoanaerobaculia bacterium]|nr:mechanosensitive ion channel family protein [Thermoanaerobaculia bacterium]